MVLEYRINLQETSLSSLLAALDTAGFVRWFLPSWLPFRKYIHMRQPFSVSIPLFWKTFST